MQNLYSKLNIPVDIETLRSEVNNIVSSVNWENNQIALQWSKHESWHEDVDKYGYVRKEHECINWHSSLENSYIKKLILDSNINVSSARIMLLPPVTCYITHVDLYTRYQIPVTLEPLKSFLVFNEKNVVLPMKPGDYYWINTHEIHNYINGAYTDRINIIFNDADELPYLDNPHISRLFENFNKEVEWK